MKTATTSLVTPPQDEHFDGAWVALNTPRFTIVRPFYEAYAEFLKGVLKQACKSMGINAVVDARAKEVPSSAEKILRKKRVYLDPRDPLPPDPLIRITDLCGGRVIVQTAAQVKAVCQFIEKTFEIDWPNSEDVSGRLKPTEFGYRSVHYIISVDPALLANAGIGIKVPEGVLGFNEGVDPYACGRPLKAEIQVRTILEHAYADIGHDLTYKTAIKVPADLHRRFAALAAILENADRDFEGALQSYEAFRTNYGAYHEKGEVEKEIALQRIVLSCAPANLRLVARIGQMAFSIGQHETALAVLKDYQQQPNPEIQRICGVVLTDMHWDNPNGAEFADGMRHLELACAGSRDAETICTLAECHAHQGNTKRARELYRDALAIDPSEPVAVCRYIEFEAEHLSSSTVIALTTPMIQAAKERCRIQIAGRVNLPAAWSSLAIFQLLLGESFAAMRSLAQVIELCGSLPREKDRPCAAGRALQRLRAGLQRLESIHEKPTGWDWFERLLTLGLWRKLKDPKAGNAIMAAAAWARTGKKPACFGGNAPIVIFAGACAPEMQPAIDVLIPPLQRATEGLALVLISGGTTAGMSGVAGQVARASKGTICARGYLPCRLPRGVKEDADGYTEIIECSGSDFTPMEALQGWTDLLAAGVDPKRIKLLCYAGGKISQTECVIALALGARVGLIEDAAVPKDRQFTDVGWTEHKSLVRLMKDAMTLRAFMLIEDEPAIKKEYEPAAKRAHEDYVKSSIPKDSSLQPWDNLTDDLKLSNYHQVAYAEHLLSTVGLGIRPLQNSDAPPPLLDMEKVVGKDGIRKLAEMEHGRWNVERLLMGWRYAEVKDVNKKLSPYLIPWEKLDKVIKGYDVDAIVKLPAKMRAVGLEVYQKTKR